MGERSNPTYLAVDKGNQIIGYVVPIFRGRYEPGLMRPCIVIMMRETQGSLMDFRNHGYLLILVFQAQIR